MPENLGTGHAISLILSRILCKGKEFDYGDFKKIAEIRSAIQIISGICI
jgi:hypothetical protein